MVLAVIESRTSSQGQERRTALLSETAAILSDGESSLVSCSALSAVARSRPLQTLDREFRRMNTFT